MEKKELIFNGESVEIELLLFKVGGFSMELTLMI